jgi:G2/mitotic-specific cyclin 3/4
MNTGVPQAAAKRAVFADKSNISRASIPLDDRKMSNLKLQAVQAKENFTAAQGAQKDAFLRPAQRPSSKGTSFLPSATNNGSIQPLTGCALQAPSHGTVKLNKRASTTVFKDNSVNNNTRPSTSGSGTIVTHSVEATDGSRTSSTAPFSRKPRHHQSQPALKSTQQNQQQVFSLPDTDVKTLASWEPLAAEKNLPEEDVTTQTAYLDAVEELSPEQFPVIQPTTTTVNCSPPVGDPEPRSQIEHIGRDTNQVEDVVVCAADLLDASDHEDEDFYDIDQGFTTAHSYPSGGDAPHPGVAELAEAEAEPSVTVTVMDAPRFSKQVLEEIEAARKHVEKNRSADEVEDELWDISMVAEYGDEIFEYMKEMEVSANIPRQTTLVLGAHANYADCPSSKPSLHGYPDGNPMVNAKRPHGLGDPSPRPF